MEPKKESNLEVATRSKNNTLPTSQPSPGIQGEQKPRQRASRKWAVLKRAPGSISAEDKKKLLKKQRLRM